MKGRGRSQHSTDTKLRENQPGTWFAVPLGLCEPSESYCLLDAQCPGANQLGLRKLDLWIQRRPNSKQLLGQSLH